MAAKRKSRRLDPRVEAGGLALRELRMLAGILNGHVIALRREVIAMDATRDRIIARVAECERIAGRKK